MSDLSRIERRILALRAEQEYIYELVEASSLTASPDDIATLFIRSRDIERDIAALTPSTVVI